GARRVPQLAQGLAFNLANAFARDLKLLAHFFQRMLGAVPRPKRILMIFSSRGLSVLRTCAVCSFRFTRIMASVGETPFVSCRKSINLDPSSSPTGVSSEIGCCAIFCA